MANALSSFTLDQRQPTNATMPAPAGMAPPKSNALTIPSPFASAPKAPQHALLGAAVDGFQRGFDPKGWQAGRDQAKADSQEKAKKEYATLTQVRQLPVETRMKLVPQLSQALGAQIPESMLSDNEIDAQLALMAGNLGIAPDKPEPMSAYQAEQIRLEEEKLKQPRNQFIQGPDGAIAVGNLNDGTIKTLQPGQPKPDPANYDMVTTADGVIAVNKRDPKDRIRVGNAPPRASAGYGVGFRSLTPEQVAERGYPVGTVVQVDSRGKEYVNSRPSTQQTGQPTESERSAGLHATVAMNGLRGIMAREANGYNRAGMGEQIGGVFGQENERLYDQAADEFIDGYLRAMTGAAATKNEIDTYKRQWFPALGDTPAVTQQKAAGRLNALKGMKSKAGRAWNPEWDAMIGELEGELGGARPIDGAGSVVGGAGRGLANIMRNTPQPDQPQNQSDDDMDGFVDSLFDGGGNEVPEGVDPADWEYFTPEMKQQFMQGAQ